MSKIRGDSFVYVFTIRAAYFKRKKYVVRDIYHLTLLTDERKKSTPFVASVIKYFKGFSF